MFFFGSDLLKMFLLLASLEVMFQPFACWGALWLQTWHKRKLMVDMFQRPT